MIGFSFIIFSLLYIPPPPPSYLLFSFYYMHTYAQVYIIIWMISWKWLINAIITTGCSMIYMRRQVSLGLSRLKSQNPDEHDRCVCVCLRERVWNSNWFALVRDSLYVFYTIKLPTAGFDSVWTSFFVVVAVIGVVLFERTLDLVISFYNLVWWIHSSTAAWVVCRPISTLPQSLERQNLFNFRMKKKNSNYEIIYQDDVIFSPRLSNIFCRLYIRLAYNNV